MKKLKMFGVALFTMLFCTVGASAASISFSENSENGNITITHNLQEQLQYQWVHVDDEVYQGVEAKLKGIVAEIKTAQTAVSAEKVKVDAAISKYNAANEKYQAEKAKDSNSEATKLARIEVANAYTEYENVMSVWQTEYDKYNAKVDEFNSEVAKIAPINNSNWKNVTSNTIAFDNTGYAQADAAVIWVKTNAGNESKIYLYQESDQSLRAEVDCPVIRKFCEVDNGKYYGKNGDEVTKEVYDRECGVVEKKVCKVEDGKYYGLEGNEVTEDVYKKECEQTNPTCKVEDGKYFDKDGNEVTEEEYNKSCLICKVEDGKYYGKDGKEVTKEEYDKSCSQAVTNPKTGYALPIAAGLVVLGAGAVVITLAHKKKLFKQI